MEDINIKREIMDLCSVSVKFWIQFKEEINAIASDDKAELVLKWKNYFIEHPEIAIKFSQTKQYAQEIIADLIMQGVLVLED